MNPLIRDDDGLIEAEIAGARMANSASKDIDVTGAVSEGCGEKSGSSNGERGRERVVVTFRGGDRERKREIRKMFK